MLKQCLNTLCSVVILALFISSSAGAQEGQWRPLGPEAGSISALAIDPSSPQTVYAGTIGGSVFKSTNGGVTWNATRQGLPGHQINELMIDPTAPQTIYAGTNLYSYKSTDGGGSWRVTGDNISPGKLLAMDPIASQTLYAKAGSGYHKSTDGGETWIRQSSPFSEITAMAIDPMDPQIIYACNYASGSVYGLVYKSTDGGKTWRSADTSLYRSFWNVGEASHLIIDPMTPEIIYASSGREAARRGIFKTVNGNDTWSEVFSDDYVNALIMDPNASQTLYAGTENMGILKTIDGGATWNPVNSGLSNLHILSLTITPDSSQTIYAGTRAGIFKSTDAGNNWMPINSGLLSAVLLSLAVDPLAPVTLYSGSSKTGLYKSLDGGISWDLASTQLLCAYVLVIDPANSQVLYALSDQSLLKSVNSGQDWVPASDGIDWVVQDLVIAPAAPHTLYAATYSGGVYKSTDGAAHWVAANTGMSGRPMAIAVDPENAETVYAGTYANEIFKSEDAGENWFLTGVLPSEVQGIISLAINPSDTLTIFAGTRDHGLFKSTDGGINWHSVNIGISNTYVRVIEFDNLTQIAYAGTNSGGVLRSTDGGDNWSNLGSDLFSLSVNGLKLIQSDPPMLYAATADGLWAYTTPRLSDITINTNPPGYAFIVDGRTYYSPRTFSWAPGDNHTISVPTPQEWYGTRHVFSNWSDGGDITHIVTVSESPVTYTANLSVQHELTVSISPSNGGEVETSPISTDGYFDSGMEVNLRAISKSGYVFSGWSGDLSGTTDTQSITMSEPRSVTASFAAILSSNIAIAATPAGRSFVVDGISYAASQTFSWPVGSSHEISVVTPQGTAGTRYVFSGWSDGGAIRHTIIVPADSTTYTATFATQYLLTASVLPQAGGIIAAGPVSPDGYYDSGTSVQLRATANLSYSFWSWIGDLTGTANPQSVIMSEPRNVVAAFRLTGPIPSRPWHRTTRRATTRSERNSSRRYQD